MCSHKAEMPRECRPARRQSRRCSRALRLLADAVGSDHADPMNFPADIDIGGTSFSLLHWIDLLGIDGLSAPCGWRSIAKAIGFEPDGPPAMTI